MNEPGGTTAEQLAGPAAPADARAPVQPPADFTAFFGGRESRAYENLGAHPAGEAGAAGVRFAVWAPHALQVQVIGDFNAWNPEDPAAALAPLEGIWSGFVPGAAPGMRYKFRVVPADGGPAMDKADPFAFHAETPPQTASVIWDLDYAWGDRAWMRERAARHAASAPLAIYEVHLGSWRRPLGNGHRWFNYRDIAPRLADYARRMGFTHVELLPLTEHPYYGSWGYQTTGYFAPTSRYGTPQDFMALVDCLHQQGIGVILDWVPSHFASDGHGLVWFDGTHLFEHADPRLGFHPDWKSAIFDYGRAEVRSFLLSSARFWLERYHVDGLRLDAVASMLYRDYSRGSGEWLPNRHGGRDNLEAIEFLRQLNTEIGRLHPDVLMIAEESTAWPKVSRPVDAGGLGFGLKWDLGWMHDTLQYFARDPIHRRYHHGEFAGRVSHVFAERYLLALSHDEVVHGKGSLFGKMPGNERQKYAGLRLLYGYLYAHPGKKLLFMGGELALWPEWSHEATVEWHLEAEPQHAGVQRWVADLNRVYGAEPALHALDDRPEGFEWIDAQDAAASTLSFLRRASPGGDLVLAVLNFTPVPRLRYRVGVPRAGLWQEILNSDARDYAGGGLGNAGGVQAEPVAWHRRPASVLLTLPPLAALFFVSRAAPAPGGHGPSSRHEPIA